MYSKHKLLIIGSLCLECIKNQTNGGQSMKKVLSTIAISAMVIGLAGTAFAATDQDFTKSYSFNVQTQTQNLTAVDGDANGMISSTTQAQKGVGNMGSWDGSAAWEGQAQGELTKVPINNGFAVHRYNQGVGTYGNSHGENFAYGKHFEKQDLKSGIATVGDGNGTLSLSGMGTVESATSNIGSFTEPGAQTTNAGTWAGYNNSYRYKNVGDTSRIIQNGFQNGSYTTDVHSQNDNPHRWVVTGASASVDAAQIGATIANNNGNGTYMAGGGAAVGTAKVTATTLTRRSNAQATAEQAQQHSYKQFANNGAGQSQWAVGTVGTYNKATAQVGE
jgi:hypothetical protein